MKKLLFFWLLPLLSFVAFADLYPVHRSFELGAEARAAVSNNYFKLPDYLHEEIVLDLRQIADGISGKGLCFDAMFGAKAYMNLNFGRNLQLSFFSGSEGSGYVNVAKDLFNLLGKGYEIGDHKDFKIKGYGDAFAFTGFSVFKRLDTFSIRVTPTYFIPLVYVADASATVEVENTSGGKIRAVARAPVDIYTVIDMEDISPSSFTTDSLSEAAASGGLDLALAAEKKVLPSLDVGLFTRIPVVPGRMKHKMTANVYAYYTEEKLLGYLDETHKDSSDHGVDDIVYGSASFTVHRPFRLGAEAAWRPFGSWMTFRPMLAFAVRNPYSSSMLFYPEYSLAIETAVFNIVGLTASTGYENRVFVQSLAFMFNVRIVELDLGVSLRGADFSKSFAYSGAGAYASVKIGF